MNTLDYILNKYQLNPIQKRYPIEIPNTDRVSLAHLFKELKFLNGAEIGVERGIYSEILCKNNPKLQLYCIDAWKAYGEYRDHTRQSTMDTIYNEALKRLQPYPCKLIQSYSVPAAETFIDGSLDFVYIDANHELSHVIADIKAWSPKVRTGGIIAGHDYIRRKGSDYVMHVPQAVHAWAESYEIAPWFVLGRKNAPEGERRDSVRSWFWVKQEEKKLRPGNDRD